LIQDNKEMMDMDLEAIILASSNSNAAIFNNAAQVWNHTFFWNSITPSGGGKPTGEILVQIEKDFGSYESFIAEFKQAALTQFGSGWAWLVYKDNKLHIIKTANAATPITDAYEPILACDVWEHAYYIDYRNRRPDYVTSFIDHMINWKFAELHFVKARK
jgi:Fe-Mn family superoxide dismutase